MTSGADPAALPSFAPAPAASRRAFVAQIMGLPVSVHVRGPRAADAEVADAVETFFEALRADDATFSTWRDDSEVSRIRCGTMRLEDAGPKVREVAALCEEASRRTDGAFSAWLPGPDGTAAFDPTGLVKGWAVRTAFAGLVDRLAAFGDHDALVSAGGDVAVHCARNDTPDWVVGVEDPQDRTRILRRIPLRRGAVATSGTAARGEHILDPVTGRPARGLRSATVVGPDLMWADVYATAVFVAGAGRSAAWLRRLDAYSALVVGPDGTVEPVPGPGH